MNEKVVLIGAGSAMFTRELVSDIIRDGWECELALVDIDSEALSVAEKLSSKMIEARRANIVLTAAGDRREALKGATAVICTIGVGGRRAWENDVLIPRKYGIYQPIGDSVMPGGTSRALRMIPAMVDIAKDVLDLAPEALFFNYANPMAPVCRAVRKATGANMVGLCNGVFHVGKYLADVLDVDADQVKYTAVGMNHLTWFTELRVNGQDAMPRLRKLGKRFASARTDGRNESVVAQDNPFSWQLFDLFGAFPAVLDVHVVEFFPHLFAKKGAYYGKTLGLDTHRFEDIIAEGDRIFSEMREAAFSPDPLGEDYFDEGISGEYAQVTDIIAGIRDDASKVYSANLPNQGQIPNLPSAIIVECPCLTDGNGLRPIVQPPMDAALAGTLATRFQWVETVVNSALEGSREKLVQALILDGAVESIEIAQKLAEEFLKINAAYLPQFDTPVEPTMDTVKSSMKE